MLILQRKKDQAIVLGGGIEILITEIKGDIVKIGIKAPKNIPVHRKEVYEAIQKANLDAANSQYVDFDSLKEIIPPNS